MRNQIILNAVQRVGKFRSITPELWSRLVREYFLIVGGVKC